MTVWVTADWHLSHEAIVRFCNRPFSSIEDMNETILYNTLNLVAKNDTLYILGDFAWNQQVAKETAHKLDFYCSDVRYICGNHDKSSFTKTQAEMLRFNHRKYYLSHYPLATAAPKLTNIHGHCHGTFHEQPWQVDVGVDAVGFAPVSMEWVEQHTKPFSRKDENELVEAIMEKYGTTQQEER